MSKDYKVLKQFLSSEDIERGYKEASVLKEDIDFFKLYMKREKKSDFSFDVRFSKGMGTAFFNDLWDNYYRMFTDDLHCMIFEHMIVYRLMKSLDDNLNTYTEEQVATILEYFEKEYSMDLEDYVGNFIGCSLGCSGVLQKLRDIKKTHFF